MRMSLSMLDTDTCAFILRRSSPTLLARVQTVALQQQASSVITLADLLCGVQVSSNVKDFGRVQGARGRELDGLTMSTETLC